MAVILLVTQALPQMRAHESAYLGRLLTPRHDNSAFETVIEGMTWAADNDGWGGVDYEAFDAMLDRLQQALIDATPRSDRRGEAWVNRPLFVTVPDVVADARATAQQWVRWSPAVRRRGLPLAFVAQDGCERGLVPMAHEFDALFIGGSTEWKLGPDAERLVRAAKRAGKWVHMGRVNSEKRMRYAAEIGCDSIDGTSYVLWRDRYLNKALGRLESMTPQQRLAL